MTRPHHTPPLAFDTIDEVVDAVRGDGGRLSLPRRRIVEALFEAEAPVSADDLARGLGLDSTSVYRNLEKLEELGIARHAHLGHGPGRYALVGRGTREYLVCEVCDKVTAVDPSELDAARGEIRTAFGFAARFGHFPIVGTCADCQAG